LHHNPKKFKLPYNTELLGQYIGPVNYKGLFWEFIQLCKTCFYINVCLCICAHVYNLFSKGTCVWVNMRTSVMHYRARARALPLSCSAFCSSTFLRTCVLVCARVVSFCAWERESSCLFLPRLGLQYYQHTHTPISCSNPLPS